MLDHAFGAGWGSVSLGDGPVRARAQRFLDEATARGHDAYVLFGTFHDSEGQIEAFRRLVGPGGLRGLTAVTVEQLRATGQWADVPEVSELGDDLDITAYLERGDLAAFDRLGERHRDGDYVAWKLGYAPKVLDLLVTARAASPSYWFGGCDMPTGTQELLSEVPEKYLGRLREIHCLDALQEATRDRRGPRRVAMLWGQAHLGSLPSFLPPSAEVLSINVLGFRTGPETLEAKLAPSLVLADPLFVPLSESGDVAALVYPDAVLGASVDRVHEAGDLRPTRIAFVSPVATRVLLAEHSVDIVPHCASGVCVGQASLDVPPGDHRYVATFGALRMAGAVHLRQGVAVEIRFDPAQVSYGQILQIAFSVVEDPTEVNRQGPDSGTQYRSEVFYLDDAQKHIAEAYIAQLDKAHAFARPIAPRVDPLKGFYPAEAYHQDYLYQHPSQPYIAMFDLPKVDNFKRVFPDLYNPHPVLTRAAQ